MGNLLLLCEHPLAYRLGFAAGGWNVPSGTGTSAGSGTSGRRGRRSTLVGASRRRTATAPRMPGLKATPGERFAPARERGMEPACTRKTPAHQLVPADDNAAGPGWGRWAPLRPFSRCRPGCPPPSEPRRDRVGGTRLPGRLQASACPLPWESGAGRPVKLTSRGALAIVSTPPVSDPRAANRVRLCRSTGAWGWPRGVAGQDARHEPSDAWLWSSCGCLGQCE